MIPAPLDSITAATIDALISNPVREKRSIDYKLSTYGGQHSQRREFLADVSSFANAIGGDLVIGVEEREGLPVGIPGIEIANIDAEIQRLQQMILHGIEPRLTSVEIHPVALSNGNSILVIRMPRSWNAPHRVVLEGHDKFYTRDTNGKHPMDVDELREAFTLANRVEQRIRGFRNSRFEAIKANRTFEPLSKGGTLILHLIPLSAATRRDAIQIQAMQSKNHLLRPMSEGGNSRINLDGIIVYSPNIGPDGKVQSTNGYTQLYRNGTIEAVMVFSFTADRDGELIIPSEWYEQCILEAFGPYLRAMRELDIVPPVYLFLGFANVRAHRFAVNRSLFFPAGPRSAGYLDRDDIELGEMVIENLSEDPTKILRPLFDQVWQAFGFARSYNFNPEGKWTGQRR